MDISVEILLSCLKILRYWSRLCSAVSHVFSTESTEQSMIRSNKRVDLSSGFSTKQSSRRSTIMSVMVIWLPPSMTQLCSGRSRIASEAEWDSWSRHLLLSMPMSSYSTNLPLVFTCTSATDRLKTMDLLLSLTHLIGLLVLSEVWYHPWEFA